MHTVARCNNVCGRVGIWEQWTAEDTFTPVTHRINSRQDLISRHSMEKMFLAGDSVRFFPWLQKILPRPRGPDIGLASHSTFSRAAAAR